MENLENTRLSLDEIAVALKRLSSGSNWKSQSVEEFHTKITAFFPLILYESNESLWNDEEEPEESLIPLWWDELDEKYELDELHWLTRIQKYELLKPEEVVRTMESIEAGIFAQAALDGQLPSFNISKYGRDKVERVVQLGIESFDYMLVHNLKLGLHIARKYGRRIEIDDAFQYAFFGLMQAVRKFDWRLGHQFSTYATWWVRQSISRAIADNESTIRLPVHIVDRVNSHKRDLRDLDANIFTTASEVTVKDKSGKVLRTEPSLAQLGVTVEMDDNFKLGLDTSIEPLEFWDTFHQAPWLLAKYETPDDSVSFVEFLAISKDLLERLTRFVLSEQQAEILKLRNGYVNSEPMTLDDIGKIYQVTRERIRQIESKALKRVYTFLDGVDLQNYWEVIDRVSTQYQENEANSPEALATQKRIAKQEKDAEGEHKRRYDDGYLKPEKPDQAANAERSLKAATNKISQVKWALEKLKFETVTTSMQVAAEARLKNPEASYSELARYLGGAITKDMVASALRRLISLAVTHSGEQPPEID